MAKTKKKFFQKSGLALGGAVLLAFLCMGVYLGIYGMPGVAEATLETPTVLAPTVDYRDRQGVVSMQGVSKPDRVPRKDIEELKSRYESTADRRLFIEYAISHPQAGGLFYAKRALVECIAVASVQSSANQSAASLTGQLDEIRISKDRYNQFLRGCYGVSSMQGLDIFGHSELTRSDPIFSVMNDFPKDRQPNALSLSIALQLVEDALQLNDPYVLADSLRLAVGAASSFDGIPIDASFRKDLQKAVLITSCDLGIDCKKDIAANISCVYRGLCFRSSMDAILSDPKLSAQGRTRVIDLSLALNAAVRSRSISSILK